MKTLKPGSMFAEKYQICKTLGAGGSGVVYEATHTTLDRQVALKLLLAPIQDLDTFRLRFQREAKAMSRLDHPNAIKVFDFGEDEGVPYIVMELLEGHSLEYEVARGPMQLERTLEIAVQICDALSAAHELNLVHRDVKPENIFIVEEEAGPHAVLLDFGLAFIDSDEKLQRVTQDGSITGTPQFLSPEQAVGYGIGPPSDVYSLGCVLYEMLTAEPVFRSDSIAKLLSAHLFLPPTSLRVRNPMTKASAILDNLVLSMLSKEAEQRPSARDLAATFRKMLGSDDVRGRGRPSKLLGPRIGRSITQTKVLPIPRAEDDAPTLGVIGEISSDLVIAASSAGFRPIAFEGQYCDVLVIEGLENITPELASTMPVIAVLPSDSIADVVELLKIGVEDVLSSPKPEEIIRKALRIHRSRTRRG